MQSLTRSALVFLGAGLGANVRYWVGIWAQRQFGANFPWGTFIINVTGSLTIGLALALLGAHSSNHPYRLLGVVGFLGGYTTFSTFSFDALFLLRDRYYSAAFGYILGSVALSILGAWIGFAIGIRFNPDL